MAMTTDNKIAIGQMGLQGLQGLLAGMDNSGAEKDAQSRDDAFFRAILDAMTNQSGVDQSITDENMARAQAFSNANPLGGEQKMRAQNVLFRGGLDALSNRQLAHGTSNLAAGFSSRPDVQSALGDKAINDAITQRRIATAGIDPRAAQQIGGTNGYADMLFGDLQNSQNFRRDNAAQQLQMIQDRQAGEQAQANQPHESGWKKFAKIAIPIGAAVAAPFTGGGSLGLMALGAGAGAASGALDGGWKGAALGAGVGGASGYAAGKAGVGRLSGGHQLNNSMTAQSLPAFTNTANTLAGSMPRSVPTLPSGPSPVTSIPGLAPTVQPQRPPIQQALSRPPQATPTGASFGFGQGLDFTTPNYPNGQLNWFGRNIPLPRVPEGGPVDRVLSRPIDGQSVMRAPTGLERFEDMGRGVRDIINQFMPQTLPGSSTTPIQSVLQSPMGRVATGGMALTGGFGGTASTSSMEAQQVVAKLMDAMKAYSTGSPADVKASQQLVEMMRPFLSKF